MKKEKRGKYFRSASFSSRIKINPHFRVPFDSIHMNYFPAKLLVKYCDDERLSDISVRCVPSDYFDGPLQPFSMLVELPIHVC